MGFIFSRSYSFEIVRKFAIISAMNIKWFAYLVLKEIPARIMIKNEKAL